MSKRRLIGIGLSVLLIAILTGGIAAGQNSENGEKRSALETKVSEKLAGAVAAGKITEEKADALLERQKNGNGSKFFKHKRHHGKHGRTNAK